MQNPHLAAEHGARPVDLRDIVASTLEAHRSGAARRQQRVTAQLTGTPVLVEGDSVRLVRGGMGLGLALVRGLTELHGGKVEVSSGGLGCGSRFAVHLPVHAATH
jgi:signal transduction histidine kinase